MLNSINDNNNLRQMESLSYVNIKLSSKKKSKPFQIPIDMKQKVSDLKEKIYETLKIKESNQVLKFFNKGQIVTLKDHLELCSYNISNKSIITLDKFFKNDSEFNIENSQNQFLIEEFESDSDIEKENNDKMDISKRIDFFNKILKTKQKYEIEKIEEEVNDELEDNEDQKLNKIQNQILNFAKFNEKIKIKDMIQELSKYPNQIIKEIIEFQDENGWTSLHYLIQNQNDFFIGFLLERLKHDLLTIEGENCANPLIFSIKHVIKTL